MRTVSSNATHAKNRNKSNDIALSGVGAWSPPGPVLSHKRSRVGLPMSHPRWQTEQMNDQPATPRSPAIMSRRSRGGERRMNEGRTKDEAVGFDSSRTQLPGLPALNSSLPPWL